MLTLYLQLVCFAIAFGCAIAFLVTGRKNRILSGCSGAFLFFGVIAQLISRFQ
jgi:hypothetical protein